VDNIPKTELRFLNDVFGNLPCQAIHCCLTGYNELETITPEVTEAFINCISNTQFAVQVDNNFILVCIIISYKYSDFRIKLYFV
jgi:hypothetical protein